MTNKSKIKQPEISPGKNPNNVADQDDLHEIQVSDDLNEPDPEAQYPPTVLSQKETQSES
ncbi:hypothetical protein MTO98_15315 [Mucilaginibacter sp. SMC90]|uniref:hypothetical protein n=1 Tax=unclassified Mucilaginibacter TaxID=2617802 RepID=UPI001FB3518F|nr:hypothetical protein [Mucilaginibacter sp. SMC90]UOE52444.1 hypothetical protein MTO98_15315 [Mucilaginibacter sp. SMC90]